MGLPNQSEWVVSGTSMYDDYLRSHPKVTESGKDRKRHGDEKRLLWNLNLQKRILLDRNQNNRDLSKNIYRSMKQQNDNKKLGIGNREELKIM